MIVGLICAEVSQLYFTRKILHTLLEIFRFDAFFKALDQVTQQATVAISAAGDEPKSWEREQLLGFLDCKVARLYHMNSSGVRA